MTSTEAGAAELIRVGAVTVDLARQVVRRGAEDIRLRPQSFDVLTVLVNHAGQVVSKQRLIELVWGDVAVTDDSLVQCLVEIRRALGDTPDAIRTIRGRGYLLDGEVEHLTRTASGLGGTADPVQPPVVAPTAGAPPPERPPSAVGASPSWRLGSTFTAVAAVAFIAVVGAVLGLGSGKAPGGRLALRDSMNADARRALDEGLGILGESRAQTDLQRARQLFERAVALDDGYAAAHAALGNVLVLLSAFGVQPPLDLLPRAGVAARRAITLDPTLASGWQALAHVQTQAEWDWTGAENSYRRAIALDPSAQLNMLFAHLLVGVGRTPAAVAESDRLLALEPDSAWRLSSNCIVKYLARRPEQALAACDRSVAVDPAQSIAHFWRALALSALNRHDEAMEAALASRRSMGFAPTWLVGYLHARAGRLDDAREVLRAVEARAATIYVPPVEIAFLRAAVGDRSAALDWLERGYRARGPWLELLAVHPAVDPLRGEPRFKALLAALRLAEPS